MRTHFKILSAVLFLITSAFFFTYCSDEPSLNSTASESFSTFGDDEDDSFLDPVTGQTIIKYRIFSPILDPYTEYNWGQATNCTTGLTHNSGYLSRPMDLGGFNSTSLVNAPAYFRCSANIKSIRTIRKTGLCLNPPPAGSEWVNDGVLVELYTGYNGTGTKIGEVYYGHLQFRLGDQIINNPNGTMLGNLGSSNPAIPCYNGIHVHMECSSNGKRQVWDCGASSNTAGNDLVYRFFSDNTL